MKNVCNFLVLKGGLLLLSLLFFNNFATAAPPLGAINFTLEQSDITISATSLGLGTSCTTSNIFYDQDIVITTPGVLPSDYTLAFDYPNPLPSINVGQTVVVTASLTNVNGGMTTQQSFRIKLTDDIAPVYNGLTLSGEAFVNSSCQNVVPDLTLLGRLAFTDCASYLQITQIPAAGTVVTLPGNIVVTALDTTNGGLDNLTNIKEASFTVPLTISSADYTVKPPVNIKCSGPANGKIDIDFTTLGAGDNQITKIELQSGATLLQTLTLPTTFPTTESFIGLNDGTYQVIVYTNSNQCSTIHNVSISTTDVFLLGYTMQQSDCDDGIGCITGRQGTGTITLNTILVNATIDYQPYSITLSDDNNSCSVLLSPSYSLTSPFAIPNLASGNYKVSMQDVNGCIATTNIIVNQNPYAGDYPFTANQADLDLTLDQTTLPYPSCCELNVAFDTQLTYYPTIPCSGFVDTTWDCYDALGNLFISDIKGGKVTLPAGLFTIRCTVRNISDAGLAATPGGTPAFDEFTVIIKDLKAPVLINSPLPPIHLDRNSSCDLVIPDITKYILGNVNECSLQLPVTQVPAAGTLQGAGGTIYTSITFTIQGVSGWDPSSNTPVFAPLTGTIDLITSPEADKTTLITPVTCIGDNTGEIELTFTSNGLAYNEIATVSLFNATGVPIQTVNISPSLPSANPSITTPFPTPDVHSFTGLTAGLYTISTNYIDGCVSGSSETITTISDIQDINITTVGSTCNTTTGTVTTGNGSVSFDEPIGGTPPYTYTLNGTLLNPSDISWVGTRGTISNLSSGTYNLTVTDANPCLKVFSFSIINDVNNDPLDFIINIPVSPPISTSPGICEATIIFDPTVVIAPTSTYCSYTAVWSVVPASGPIPIIDYTTNAPKATVTLPQGVNKIICTVTNNISGATSKKERQFTVVDNEAPTIIAPLAPIVVSRIPGACNYEIPNLTTLLVKGVHYLENCDVDRIEQLPIAGTLYADVTDYSQITFDIIDKAGNISNGTILLQDAGTSPVISINKVNASCSTTSNGSIDVVVTGLGTGYHTITSVDITGATTPCSFNPPIVGLAGTNICSNLSAGNYQSTITYQDGCTDIANYTILPPKVIDIVFGNVTGSICDIDPVNKGGSFEIIALNDITTSNPIIGAVQVQVSIGTAPTLIPLPHLDATVTIPPTHTVAKLPSGSYNVTVTDPAGCTTTETIVIPDVSDPSAYQFDLVQTDITEFISIGSTATTPCLATVVFDTSITNITPQPCGINIVWSVTLPDGTLAPITFGSSPTEGSVVLPIGVHNIVCTVTNTTSGNTTQEFFTVTVENKPIVNVALLTNPVVMDKQNCAYIYPDVTADVLANSANLCGGGLLTVTQTPVAGTVEALLSNITDITYTVTDVDGNTTVGTIITTVPTFATPLITIDKIQPTCKSDFGAIMIKITPNDATTTGYNGIMKIHEVLKGLVTTFAPTHPYLPSPSSISPQNQPYSAVYNALAPGDYKFRFVDGAGCIRDTVITKIESVSNMTIPDLSLVTSEECDDPCAIDPVTGVAVNQIKCDCITTGGDLDGDGSISSAETTTCSFGSVCFTQGIIKGASPYIITSTNEGTTTPPIYPGVPTTPNLVNPPANGVGYIDGEDFCVTAIAQGTNKIYITDALGCQDSVTLNVGLLPVPTLPPIFNLGTGLDLCVGRDESSTPPQPSAGHTAGIAPYDNICTAPLIFDTTVTFVLGSCMENIQVDWSLEYPDGTVVTNNGTTINISDGSIFLPVGIYTVNCTITNNGNIIENEDFTVTVKDCDVPIVVQPLDTIISRDLASCSYVIPDVIGLVNSNATDNCCIDNSLTVQVPPAGVIPPGFTGNIYVTVYDCNGNFTVATVGVTFLDTAIFTLTPNIVNCASNTNGVIDVAFTRLGVGFNEILPNGLSLIPQDPLDVVPAPGTLSPPLTAPNNVSFTGLRAGTYTLYVTMSDNCVIERVTTIGADSETELDNPYFNPIQCYGGNTELDVRLVSRLTPGVAPYMYSLDGVLNPNTNPDGTTSATFLNITAGTYALSVQDQKGCIDIMSVIIDEPTAFNVTLSFIDPPFFGATTGEITSNATGGVLPGASGVNYDYGITSATIANLPDVDFFPGSLHPLNPTFDMVSNKTGLGTGSYRYATYTEHYQQAIDWNQDPTGCINIQEQKLKSPSSYPYLELYKAVEDANGNGFAEYGEILTYTLILKHTHPTDAIKVGFVDPLHEWVGFSSDLTPGSTSGTGTVITTVPFGYNPVTNSMEGAFDLGPGSVMEYQYKVLNTCEFHNGEWIANQATYSFDGEFHLSLPVIGKGYVSGMGNNTAIQVKSPYDLHLASTVLGHATSTDPRMEILYTLTVTNNYPTMCGADIGLMLPLDYIDNITVPGYTFDVVPSDNIITVHNVNLTNPTTQIVFKAFTNELFAEWSGCEIKATGVIFRGVGKGEFSNTVIDYKDPMYIDDQTRTVISKVVPEFSPYVSIGDKIAYHINVKNTSCQTVYDLLLRDTLSKHTPFNPSLSDPNLVYTDQDIVDRSVSGVPLSSMEFTSTGTYTDLSNNIVSYFIDKLDPMSDTTIHIVADVPQGIDPTVRYVDNSPYTNDYRVNTIRTIISIPDQIVIPNFLTPNGDGKNEKLVISKIEEMGNKHNNVVIIDRWGNVVASYDNYDNVNVVWSGRNSDGSVAMQMVYFYRLTLIDKNEVVSGFILVYP